MPIRVLYEISEALAEVTMARVGDGHHVRQMGMEPPAGAVGIELQNLGRLAYAEIQARLVLVVLLVPACRAYSVRLGIKQLGDLGRIVLDAHAAYYSAGHDIGRLS